MEAKNCCCMRHLQRGSEGACRGVRALVSKAPQRASSSSMPWCNATLPSGHGMMHNQDMMQCSQ
eukprot:scaffold315034_cov24-Tisochrysis_lutea.AAC.2